jgi:predicted PurR-regulated permease PerM
MIVAGIQFGSLMPVLWVLILSVVLQNIEGNIVKPKLIGDSMNLNPLAVLVSLVYWTWLWGAIGIILAIPITAAIKVICDNVESLEPIGILLGGKKDIRV